MHTLDELAASLASIAEKQEATFKRATADKAAATKARNLDRDRIEALEKQGATLTEALSDLSAKVAELQKRPTPNEWPDVAARLVDALKAQPLMLAVGAVLCFALAVGGLLLHYHPELILPPAKEQKDG